ncbi:MAG TPA: outer membrane beta-barrel protein [Gemmatimonadales bacterium]
MSFHRGTSIAVVALLGAAPLAGQRAIVFNVNGGGYNHLTNLSAGGTPTADFKPGYNFGLSVGREFTKYFALHADFTFAHAQARGTSSFAGADIHRLFYGAHLELRYPFAGGVTPFAFAGGGAVTVDQAHNNQVPTFTKPAGMLGAGIGYGIPRSNFEVFAEGKSLVYKWDRSGFDKTQWDVTYSVGLAYRLMLH